MKAVIEKFKPIKGYEGLYEVSDYGTVRSLNYQGKKRIKYLKSVKHKNGYLRIGLWYYGKRKWFMIHRLVWESFVGQIPKGYEIDHIDGNKTNNELSNLRCVSHMENMNNPITREIHLEAIWKLSKNQKWLEATREANKRLAKEPKWLKNQRKRVRETVAKPILQLDKETKAVIRKWECAMDTERELGISQSNISQCCLGKRKSAGGYIWKFE